MDSTERVSNMLRGKDYDRQPIYGWIYGNLTTEIDDVYGSLAGFEAKYEFDMAHLFSGPWPFNEPLIARLREENDGELTPQMLLDNDFMLPYDDEAGYEAIRRDVAYFKNQHNRFCYLQTQGFLEPYNGLFGIQNSLLYLALYPEEMAELYRKLADWNVQFIRRAKDCGVDMIHISDDWGSQNDMLISPRMWKNMIYPNMKREVDEIHNLGLFASLHSDGCIVKALDGIVDIGFDLIHPWQENADMPYSLYLEKYQDKFATMGGINVQNALGIMSWDELEADIRRIFGLLRGKRWVTCTSHFVQKHCKVEDLGKAYDLIYELARK